MKSLIAIRDANEVAMLDRCETVHLPRMELRDELFAKFAEFSKVVKRQFEGQGDGVCGQVEQLWGEWLE
jgi:hypothetical protein